MKPTNFFSLTLISISFILFNKNSIVSATEEEGIVFSYTGNTGPVFWDTLAGSSEVCKTGERQSPIDITTKLLSVKKSSPPKANFTDACDAKIINTGNTLDVISGEDNVALPATIFSSDDGTEYGLDAIHFHTPSEHRINGKHSDVEQHLVFKKVAGDNLNEIAVVSILYNVGKENEFLKPIIENIPKSTEEINSIKKVELSKLLKDIDSIKNAFNYDGSLTTPPCTETVEWYVNQKPLSLSQKQFSAMRDVMGFNSRFTQLRSDESIITKRSLPKMRKLFRR